jgi:hypothetical protein
VHADGHKLSAVPVVREVKPVPGNRMQSRSFGRSPALANPARGAGGATFSMIPPSRKR